MGKNPDTGFSVFGSELNIWIQGLNLGLRGWRSEFRFRVSWLRVQGSGAASVIMVKNVDVEHCANLAVLSITLPETAVVRLGV